MLDKPGLAGLLAGCDRDDRGAVVGPVDDLEPAAGRVLGVPAAGGCAPPLTDGRVEERTARVDNCFVGDLVGDWENSISSISTMYVSS